MGKKCDTAKSKYTELSNTLVQPLFVVRIRSIRAWMLTEIFFYSTEDVLF